MVVRSAWSRVKHLFWAVKQEIVWRSDRLPSDRISLICHGLLHTRQRPLMQRSPLRDFGARDLLQFNVIVQEKVGSCLGGILRALG